MAEKIRFLPLDQPIKQDIGLMNENNCDIGDRLGGPYLDRISIK